MSSNSSPDNTWIRSRDEDTDDLDGKMERATTYLRDRK